MSTSSTIKIAFLLGSGISIPAGMPKLHEITERVLSGKDIYYATGEEIFTSYKPNLPITEENVPRVLKFLYMLKVEIDYYYEKHRFKQDTSYCANYEDLYYAASQIYYSELGEYDIPAVQPLVDKILPYTQPLLKRTNIRSEWILSQLAGETMKYIEYVVFHELNKDPKPLDYLDFIKEACEDKGFSRVDIFTLNHDTVLEKYLERYLNQNEVLFSYGFFKPEGEQNGYWKPRLFNSRSFRVHLFKLHGSINWFHTKDWSKIVIPSPSDMIKKDASARILAVDTRPILLIGTYNKMLEYTSGIFEELHYQFYRSLRQVKKLVICGYGFGDRGINNKIIEWIYPSNNHRIILIDHEPETVRNKARGSIRDKWNDWINEKKLIIIAKKIEETSWKEIRDSLLKTQGYDIVL